MVYISKLQVIRERQAELEAQLKEQTESSMQNMDDGDMPAVIGKRKRLAFLDMLLYMAREYPDFGEQDIREEVDTFMFEVHLIFSQFCHQ